MRETDKNRNGGREGGKVGVWKGEKKDHTHKRNTW